LKNLCFIRVSSVAKKFKRPLPRSSNPNFLWPGICHRPVWRTVTNPKGIESFSPRLHGRATLGNRPTNFSTRNGLHHHPSKRIKPRWVKNHFTIITRRSRCASTANHLALE
jgi:hypothetical protein